MNEQDIADLAGQFPSLPAKLTPDEIPELDEWARGMSSGTCHTVRFILSLYNSEHPWKVGPFIFADAWAVWDSGHKEVFVRWAQKDLVEAVNAEQRVREAFGIAEEPGAGA